MNNTLMRTSLALPKKLNQKILDHCKSRGLSKSSYLRMIIIKDLENEQYIKK